MPRTSTALKRLGIAAVAAATIGAGVPALVSGAAQAAGGPTNQLDITPSSQTGTVGSCLAYTVTATDSNTKPSDTPTLTITLTQSSPSTGTIGFCDPNSTKAPGAPGNPVQSSKTGNGTTAATTSQNFTTTRSANGTVSVTFGVYSSNVSTVNVRAQLSNNAAVASNTATATYTAASPSPSPPASPPASPPGGRAGLTLTVLDPLIPAGSTARLVATGSANQPYELRCYTRPSTTYFTARSGAFDASASPVTFTLSLGRNTRCFIQYATNSGTGFSGSVVINVSTVLSLSTVRLGVRTYLFQGRNLPRVAGQLITLYRVDAAGNEIRTSNLVTDSTGIYRVTRTFTGTGTFRFKVRTSQTLNNAAGVSNTISVRVY